MKARKKIGMNNSIIYIDFMVGGPELSVIGTVIGTCIFLLFSIECFPSILIDSSIFLE
ncbi:hypothetical protein E4N80_08060 [Treponema denticola]|uniref:aminopeptidase n=1 Tax=Treponema denticola TaxID=158 RepID=UPI0020A2DA29|nr:aminopeptidase [Treponema denticola]UTD03962.1 hypothetical protein E4N80_08060 [Treponema denticola]